MAVFTLFTPELAEALETMTTWQRGMPITSEVANQALEHLGSQLRVVPNERADRGVDEIIRCWRVYLHGVVTA